MIEAIVLPNGEEVEVKEGSLWYCWRGEMKHPIRLVEVKSEQIQVRQLTNKDTTISGDMDVSEFVEEVESADILPLRDDAEEIREEMKNQFEA